MSENDREISALEDYARIVIKLEAITAERDKYREALEDIAADDDEGCSSKDQRAQDQRWAKLALSGDSTRTAKETK